MGSTHSTEAATADLQTESNYGFSKKEAQHLSTLRGLVCQEQKTEQHFVTLIWRCSHLLSLNSSPSKNVSDIEAHLRQNSPTQLALIQKRCQQLELLFSEFVSLNKMNAALKEIFLNNEEFLEKVSNVIGMHGPHQKGALEFVCNMCSGAEESILAKDVIELCFQTAYVFHSILHEHSFGDTNGGTIELLETRDISAEDAMIQSMTNSLLEYTKSSRDNNYFGGYSDPVATGGTSTTSIAEGRVTKREFAEWQRKVVPDLIYCSVTKFQHFLCFPPEYSQSQHQTRKSFPILRPSIEITSRTSAKVKEGEILPISSHVFGKNTSMNATNCNATTLLSPPLFAFASISMPKFGEKWYRIFAGETDGWTWQSLEHAILGYEGPTLLVIQAHPSNSKNEIVTLGAYTASKWEKNKKDFFGTAECFLFQLQPTLRVLKPLPKMGKRGGHYMYFHSNTNVNTTNPSRKDDRALGLGFGGTIRSPRLFIDSHLEECSVSYQDTSFEEGYLGLPPFDDPFSSQSHSSTLHIDSLEIYAVGDEDTIRRGFKAQYQHRDIADATLRNARTVDKTAFLGDMINNGTKNFAHRGQVDGRADGYLKGQEDEKANGL